MSTPQPAPASAFSFVPFRPGVEVRALKGRCATIGFFDGVHLGHRFLLRQVREEAARRGEESVVVTFSQHPQHVLGMAGAPALLTTREEKLALLREEGIDGCVLLHFSSGMAALPARSFMELFLRDALGISTLVVGYDHHFGTPCKGEGFEQYRHYGHELGLDVVLARPFTMPGVPKVSSSSVRRHLLAGRAEEAATLLGRPYRLEGTVVEGHHVGRSLGFPTANLRPESAQKLLPANGVYAVWAEIRGQRHPAMLNIGQRPTLHNGSDTSIEAHIMGLDTNLYGLPMACHFVARLRDERQFASLDALKAQLHADADEALTRLGLKA